MTEPTIRLAFLGAAQAWRGGGWCDAVARRTQLVFPSRASRPAAKALRQALADLGRPAALDLRVVGYSWGAWTGLALVRRLLADPSRFHPSLARADLRVTLATLDPVRTLRRALRVPRDPRLVLHNVYQRNGCHRRCPGPSDWFRGEPLDGAAENRDVTEEGRGRPERDGVPPERAPDHIQLGYLGWGGYDEYVASFLDDAWASR